MAQNTSKLKVVLTEGAAIDLEEIWSWNAHTYGIHHANSYSDFLRHEAQKLEKTHGLGRPVLTRPGFYYILLRKRSRGHGHLVVYRIKDNKVQLLHFFHTAQDWRNRLS